jgi:hypothetical protein
VVEGAGQTGIETETGGESVEALVGREVPEPVIATVWSRDKAIAEKRGPLRVCL